MDRLFFAVVPTAAARERIAAVVGQLRRVHGDGGWVAPDKWHVTLAYLGAWPQLPAGLAERAAQAAAAVLAPAPEVRLDQLGDFPGLRRPWYLGAEGSGGLWVLGHELRTCLGSAQVGFDTRPLVAHLTVRRARAPVPAAAIDPIAWTARELLLLRSSADAAAYPVLARRALPLA